MSDKQQADGWINRLALVPHPEGGYYRETYRSSLQLPDAALPEAFTGPRAASTAILFLLKGGQVSRLHRIRSDEIWHHYRGGSLVIHVFHPNGAYEALFLGPRPDRGESFQVVVPARCWFGATMREVSDFSLVGCTVAPGFDFADFEMGRKSVLMREYPAYAGLVDRLTAAD